MVKTIFSAVTALCLLASSALAHELDSNRATLVLRDRQHLAITFFVDYASVMQQVLPVFPTGLRLLSASGFGAVQRSSIK